MRSKKQGYTKNIKNVIIKSSQSKPFHLFSKYENSEYTTNYKNKKEPDPTTRLPIYKTK